MFEEHTAEVRLRIEAPTIEALFAEAGRGLAELLAAGSAGVPPASGEPERVTLRTRDRDALLVDWLNELIFRSETERRIFSEVEVERVAGGALSATIRGSEPAEEIRTLVKAATMHDVRIEESEHGVSAVVVFDV